MKIFIYPTFNKKVDVNVYSKLFRDAFQESESWTIVNRLCKWSVLGIWANLDADVFVLSWPENVVKRKFAFVQRLVLVAGINVTSLLGKKIIWIMHNKHSHGEDNMRSEHLINFMVRKSTIIITHSAEGVDFFNNTYPKFYGKCYYLPHPVYTTKIYKQKPIKWDYIIWGSIEKRKKILEFIQFSNQSDFFNRKKILICGRCKDEEYQRRIEEVCGKNITLIPRRMTDDELNELICESSFVLFTYSTSSVLSSGALIYSINYMKPIIGPNVGSFADLRGITCTYDSFKDIENIPKWDNQLECKEYIDENSWGKFPPKIIDLLSHSQVG